MLREFFVYELAAFAGSSDPFGEVEAAARALEASARRPWYLAAIRRALASKDDLGLAVGYRGQPFDFPDAAIRRFLVELERRATETYLVAGEPSV